MLKELLKSELVLISVKTTDVEDQLAEEMAAGCGSISGCGGATGPGSCGTTPKD